MVGAMIQKCSRYILIEKIEWKNHGKSQIGGKALGKF